MFEKTKINEKEADDGPFLKEEIAFKLLNTIASANKSYLMKVAKDTKGHARVNVVNLFQQKHHFDVDASDYDKKILRHVDLNSGLLRSHSGKRQQVLQRK